MEPTIYLSIYIYSFFKKTLLLYPPFFLLYEIHTLTPEIP